MLLEPQSDEFLSSEDLDLRAMSWPEVVAYWNAWLLQAQSTNEWDADDYSHGVMVSPREREALIKEYAPLFDD